MSLLAAVVVFVVGYVSGAVTRLFAGAAAVVAPVLSVYQGNELLFLSGFLFAIAHRGDDD